MTKARIEATPGSEQRRWKSARPWRRVWARAFERLPQRRQPPQLLELEAEGLNGGRVEEDRQADAPVREFVELVQLRALVNLASYQWPGGLYERLSGQGQMARALGTA